MRRLIFAAAALVLSVGCASTPPREPFDCAAGMAGLSGLVEVDEPIEGRYVVVLDPQAPGADSLTSEADALSTMTESYAMTEVQLFRSVASFAATMEEESARRMTDDPRVAFVQQDGQKRVDPRAATAAAVWGLDRSDQRDRPLDGVYDPGADGAGVHVYILDTGVDTNHPDFAGRVGDCFSSFGDGCRDDHGHGTHVAATAGGTEYGIAKQAVIHPVRVLRDGSGADSDVIEGIDWVTAHAGDNAWPAVANMSLGGDAAPALDMAVCRSLAAGVAHVVAAGNDGSDACAGSPARVLQAVTAGATDRDDRRAGFSNIGGCVDLFAPGVNITSARRGGGATVLSGTSMASPHTAGVAALCRQRHPELTADGVRACVLDNASPERVRSPGSGSPNRLLYAKED